MSRGAAPRAVTTEDEVEAESRREARESAVGAAPPHEVSEEKEYDVFRDSLLRYMGYANECGEAFVAWLPVWGVPATYGIAATYVLADTVDKGVKRWKKAEGGERSREPSRGGRDGDPDLANARERVLAGIVHSRRRGDDEFGVGEGGRERV